MSEEINLIYRDTACPECGQEYTAQSLQQYDLGEFYSCEGCAAELEIGHDDGLVRLLLAPETGEDWGE